jgi:hypothetical protein
VCELKEIWTCIFHNQCRATKFLDTSIVRPNRSLSSGSITHRSPGLTVKQYISFLVLLKKGNCPLVYESDHNCKRKFDSECLLDFDCKNTMKCCRTACHQYKCTQPLRNKGKFIILYIRYRIEEQQINLLQNDHLY